MPAGLEEFGPYGSYYYNSADDVDRVAKRGRVIAATFICINILRSKKSYFKHKPMEFKFKETV